MKKILLMLLLVACFAGVAFALTYDQANYKKHVGQALQLGQNDPIYNFIGEVDGLLPDKTGSGTIWYVDSELATAGVGTSWSAALATLQEGINKCDDNAGDYVYVASQHEEDVDGAANLLLDCPGMTIRGFGSGDEMPEFSLIAQASTVSVTAADITIYNLRFLGDWAGGSTLGIDVQATGDGFRVLGCEFRSNSSSEELLIALNVSVDAENLVIAGNSFVFETTGGESSAIVFEGASNKTVVYGNYFNGDWSGYVIDGTGASSVQMLVKNNVIHNLDGALGYLISFNTATTGDIIGNICYGAGSSQAIVANSMFVSPDNVTMTTVNVETRTYEAMMGSFTGVTGVGQGASIYADMVLAQTDLTTIEADVTNLYITGVGTGVYPTGVTNESILAFMLAKGSTATAATYSNVTDSMEMQSDKIGAYTGDGGTNDNDSVKADVDLVQTGITSVIAAVVAMNDSGFVGTNSATSQTTPVVTLLSGFGDDYFNTGWSMIAIHNENSDGNAPEGEIRDITNYISSSGTFTVLTFSANLENGDKVMVKRTEELELDVPTILGSAGTILYVDSGASAGDGTGLTWINAYITLALAEADCVAGDKVYVADGHNEAIGSLLIDVVNTSWIGLGEGDGRPRLDFDNAGEEITINAAGVVFKNFRLLPADAAVVAGIVLGANGDGVLIENCAFIDGESGGDEFRDCIVFNTGTVGSTVRNCTYKNTNATAVDQDTFVNLDAATIADATIEGCTVFGTFAEGIVWWSNAAPTNLAIRNNTFSNTTAGTVCIGTTGNATGVCEGNLLYSSAYGANGITILDPGNMACFENYAVDATNETAILVPFSATTDDITEVAAGSDTERLEWLQKQADDIGAKLGIDSSTDNVWYVDDSAGGGAGTGTSFIDADTTLQAAIDHAINNTAAYIFIAENHDETLGSAISIDCPGITIIGLGNGDARPIFTFDTGNDTMNHTVANVTWKNIIFTPSGQDCTVGVSLGSSADNVTFEDCEWRNASGNEFVDMVTLASDTDNARFIRCRFINDTSSGGAISAITNTSGACDGMVIDDCYFYGDFSTAAIEGDQADLNVRIINNTILNYSANDYAIKWSSNTSFGEFSNNRMYADVVATIGDIGGLSPFGNLATDAIDEGGIPWPTSQDTTVVGAVADGSPLERLELIQQMLTGLLSVGSNPLLGTQVTRAAGDIFNGSADQGVFRISTGRILLTHLSMTTLVGDLDATPNNVKLRSNPTAGTEADLCATLETANDELGTIYSITGTRGDALVGVDASSVTAMITPMIIGIGDIELDSSGDNANSNSVTVSMELWYFPLDAGATVAGI